MCNNFQCRACKALKEEVEALRRLELQQTPADSSMSNHPKLPETATFLRIHQNTMDAIISDSHCAFIAHSQCIRCAFVDICCASPAFGLSASAIDRQSSATVSFGSFGFGLDAALQISQYLKAPGQAPRGAPKGATRCNMARCRAWFSAVQ